MEENPRNPHIRTPAMKELSPKAQKAFTALIVFLIVACVAAAIYVIERESTSKTNSAALTSTLCAITTYPDGRDGTAVYVTDAGPDVVTVDLISDIGRHNRSVQQVTQRSGGATFAFSQSGTARSITVHSRNLGTCVVPAQEVPLSLLRADEVARFNRSSK